MVILGVAVLTLLCVGALLWLSRKSDDTLNRVEEKLDTSVDVKTGEALKETVIEQQEMTRQHISATVGTIAHETGVTKGLVYDLHKRLTALIGLMANFVKGIGK
jgi:hypothetical protein